MKSHYNKHYYFWQKRLETFGAQIDLWKFEKLIKNKKIIAGKDAFLLYQSYGFPIELTQELASERKIKVDVNGAFMNFFSSRDDSTEELNRTIVNLNNRRGEIGIDKKDYFYYPHLGRILSAPKQS